MTDLEITKRCAEAMGFSVSMRETPFTASGVKVLFAGPYDAPTHELYNPLHDDAQAMALVKKFGLHLSFEPEEGNADVMLWTVEHRLDPKYGGISFYSDLDLNRAICECVARLQEAHGG